ncbi:MAG TPA: Na+/H+ antiporter subunit E [Actinomycetaceae bacterium]|nr:Na+/H+ antiporter subunit E [Actinomycetaceae bacterium]
MPRRRFRDRIPSFTSVIWLTLVWVLLWGDITWGNLLNGVIIAYAVGIIFPLPRIGGGTRWRPIAIVILGARFAWDVLVSGFRVAWVALRPGTPKSAVIRVQLRSHSDFVLATTAAMTTLIPGSVAINAHRLTGVIYLHVFDVPAKNPRKYLEDFRETVLRQEERLLRAFATEAELADAGYRPGWRVGTGDLPGWHHDPAAPAGVAAKKRGRRA